MEAHGNVSVKGREFFATAEKVFYNELKDQVIFIAGENSWAKLSKIIVAGGTPETLEGKKIIYSRTTGKATVEGAKTLNSVPLPN
jgi:hypothetical protein